MHGLHEVVTGVRDMAAHHVLKEPVCTYVQHRDLQFEQGTCACSATKSWHTSLFACTTLIPSLHVTSASCTGHDCPEGTCRQTTVNCCAFTNRGLEQRLTFVYQPGKAASVFGTSMIPTKFGLGSEMPPAPSLGAHCSCISEMQKQTHT